ncbi:dihydrodipicolinate synthase family protein [Amycolatopsis magusensis]|uniref:dihydrodipicolinate synthase family protein n=1 Tax=Amycolatopsis magusensis TaxID=882444 RepID=UPI003798A4A6
MFTGLSAFPLTPVTDDGIDEAAYERLVGRLAEAGVDSICALGSTGSYAYLDRDERARAARLAVRGAGSVPVIVGVGALRTREVLAHVEDAQEGGAAAVLVPTMTYQPLTDDEVFGLYEEVTARLSVPWIVYDNPGTTHVEFTDELHTRIARLPHVTSIKIPPGARDRIAGLRSLIPDTVNLGISGDAVAVEGLLAGCEVWYSVLGGLFPRTALALTRAATAGDAERARALTAELNPLWELYARYGSYRVMSAMAVELGLLAEPNLPRPVRSLGQEGREAVVRVLKTVDWLDDPADRSR